jgi:hypothetical protein
MRITFFGGTTEADGALAGRIELKRLERRLDLRYSNDELDLDFVGCCRELTFEESSGQRYDNGPGNFR